MNPQKLMDELGIDLSEGDSLGMGVVRKETDLNNEEKQFLLAVERGDVPTARHFLEESQIYFNLNVNCVDPLGRTALLIAIENENIEMMQVLLAYNVELGDALLHAINEENVEAVELLLAHQAHNKKDLSARKRLSKDKGTKLPDTEEDSVDESKDGFLGGVPSSSFTPDITPIILAAHRDNYEIIKILLDRGDRIPKPHDVRCGCTECVTKSGEDSLNHSRSRINAYRALASASLIALSSKDPILTAFELSWELKRLSRLENEFKLEYETLCRRCQDFAVGLLDQTRGIHELEIILNHDPNGSMEDVSDRMTLARLKLAIKYKQKRFVSHSNCQQLLASLWYEGLPGYRRRHMVFKVLLTVTVCLVYPLISLFYLVCPKSLVGHFMRRPFIKFICHSASYMSFLFMLVMASQRIEIYINFGNIQTAPNRQYRGQPPTVIEWLIIIWVVGLIWAEVKQLWDEGVKAYVQDMWNILDFTTNSFYVATFSVKLVAYLRVQQEIADGNPMAYAPREDWDAFDPNLVAECLFSAANVFSSLKLVYIFTVNAHLGPLQISLGRMILDILKFFFFVVLVLLAFGCGINQLYWYYSDSRQRNCDICLEAARTQYERDRCDCDTTLANLWEILQSLYFAAFGLIDLKHFDLKEDHGLTRFVGRLMFGTYSTIVIIVLINMLIAMLSNSYMEVSSNSDTEWKFARSKLWISYFEDGATVPPPFNIIPSPKTFWYLLMWIKDRLCTCTKKQKRSKWQSIRKIVKKVNEREASYQAVMRDLVKRYIMQQQRGSQTEGVTEDDLNEIKQDISSFRYELLEILRNNGMKTPQTSHHYSSKSRLRRKGSRMSMDRLSRRLQPQTPGPQSTSIPEGQDPRLTALEKARAEAEREGLGSPKKQPPEGQTRSEDKQGESVEHTTDVSGMANGLRNPVFEVGAGDDEDKKVDSSSLPGELALDPNKLSSMYTPRTTGPAQFPAANTDSGSQPANLNPPSSEPVGLNPDQDISPKTRRAGTGDTNSEGSDNKPGFNGNSLSDMTSANKKVSFLGGDEAVSSEAVSETFVYEGAKKTSKIDMLRDKLSK